MRYVLETLTVGPVEVNCYILGCKRTSEAAIIDPGAEDGKIKERLKKDNLSAKYIINTHGHADHIGANGRFGLPVMIHKADAPFLSNPVKNLSVMLGMPISSPSASRVLDDADRLYVGDLLLEVIHTPGHTPGSVSIKCEDMVFTGDALFKEGIGRVDLPYGSEETLLKSIRERLMVLPDQTKVYPGHGPATTIGYEREHNPYI